MKPSERIREIEQGLTDGDSRNSKMAEGYQQDLQYCALLAYLDEVAAQTGPAEQPTAAPSIADDLAMVRAGAKYGRPNYVLRVSEAINRIDNELSERWEENTDLHQRLADESRACDAALRKNESLHDDLNRTRAELEAMRRTWNDQQDARDAEKSDGLRDKLDASTRKLGELKAERIRLGEQVDRANAVVEAANIWAATFGAGASTANAEEADVNLRRAVSAMADKITHVAIRFRGEVYSLPEPNRHHHVIALIAAETGATTVDSHGRDQGFLDGAGRYLERSEALQVAARAGQLKPSATGPQLGELYSEDVW